MRTLLILIIGLALCSLSLAAPQMQNVGGDFGKAWLTQHSNKFVTAITNTTNDLWKWGGKPQGYEVMNGKIYPLIAPTQYFYPAFTTNNTPIVINGTALLNNQNYVPPDFMSPDFTEDPWVLAQLSERPVVVVYPALNRGSSLL